MQAGIATIDRLLFVDPHPDELSGLTKSNLWLKTRGGFAEYDRTDSVAFESELVFPLRDTGLLSLGTRLYGNINPAPWTLYIGLTIPIDRIIEAAAPSGENRP
jgi:hypothetical protein